MIRKGLPERGTEPLSTLDSIGCTSVPAAVGVLLIPFVSWGVIPWLKGPFVLLAAYLAFAGVRQSAGDEGLALPPAPVVIPIALVLVLSLVHLIRSPVPYSSLLFPAHLFIAVVLYWVWWSRPQVLEPLITAAIWSGVLVPWLALQSLAAAGLPPGGPFVNPNYTATVLLVCLAVSVGVLIPVPPTRGKGALALVAAAAASAGLWLIGSRSAALGMILLWAVFLFAGRGRLRLAAVLAIALIVFVPSTVRYRVTEGYKEDPHAFSRLQIWTAAIEMGTDHPFMGVGPGLFHFYGPSYAFPTEDLPVRYGRIVRKPHNEYLRTWAEGGLMGAAAALLFLLAVSAMAVRAFRRGAQGPALATGVVLYQGLFHDLSEVLALMVLLSWCLALITPPGGRVLVIRNGFRHFAAYAAAAGVLCLSVWLNLDLASRAFWQKGQRLMDVDLAGAIKAGRTSRALNPLLPGPARDMGQMILMAGRQGVMENYRGQAEMSILAARRLNRLDSVPLRLRAALVTDLARRGEIEPSGALAEAAGDLELALELEPHNALIMLNLSDVYWDMGRRGRALDTLLDALAAEPNYLEAHRRVVDRLQVLDPARVLEAQSELAMARERAAGYAPVSDYERIILR